MQNVIQTNYWFVSIPLNSWFIKSQTHKHEKCNLEMENETSNRKKAQIQNKEAFYRSYRDLGFLNTPI